MVDNEEKMEKRVLDFMMNLDDGATIVEVSRMLGIHRVTASRYLAILKAKGLVNCRRIGKAKLFFKK